MHRKQSRFPWSPGGAARRDRLHAAAKAKKNQSHGQGGVLLLENSPKAFAPIDTRAEAAARIRGTVDSWTDICQNSDKSVSHPHARGILCQNSDTIIEKIALTLTRAVY